MEFSPPEIRNYSTPFGEPASTALRNVLILDNIFRYLSVSDLKNARRVNLVWSKTSFNFLHKKVGRLDFTRNTVELFTKQLKTGNRPLRFHSTCNIPEYMDGIDCVEQHFLINKCVSTVTSLINSSNSFPITKFKVSTQTYDSSCKKGEITVMKKFIETISSFVTELAIDRQSDESLFRQCPRSKLEFPQLKVLELAFTHFDKQDQEYWKRDLKFITNLFHHAPVLDTLVLGTYNHPKFVNDLLSAVDICHWRKIKRLTLRNVVENLQLAKLAQMRLALECFTLNLVFLSPSFCEYLMGFIATQSKTLKQLYFQTNPSEGNLVFSFPQMKVLETLKLEIWITQTLALPFISFKELFPALKNLTLDIDQSDLKGILKSVVDPLDTLENLELPKDLDDQEVILETARIFPKLKKLRVPARVSVMQVVYSSIPNLEELTLLDRDYYQLCQVLTGYAMEELENFNGNLGEPEKFKDILKQPLPFLQELKVLRIDYCRITNLMCYMGPMRLKSLQCLNLWPSRASKISKQTLYKMRQKFVVLLPENCSEIIV